MSISITINGTVIDFPSSDASPNWAQGVIDFAQAVEGALSGLSGAFDVPPTILNIDAQNPSSGPVDIPNLSFSTAQVRGAFIRLAVYRNTSSTTAYEIDDIEVIYSPNNSPGSKWEMSPSRVGDAKITFNITDAGQVQFTTTTLAGSSHVGKITYTAQALLQS